MDTKPNIYFLGIGGIGMSAIARYFMHEGRRVAGYDRTPTPLTDTLEAEGADIHFEEGVEFIPELFRDPENTLVVYTPAVPADHAELVWFRANGFTVEKRSEMLGHIARGKYVMAVAGTHGKTTTTTMTAWLNRMAARGGKDPVTGHGNVGGGGTGSAFLGGISKNFGSNLVLGDGERLAVEADEFDRSFLRLFPDAAVITSTDPDHLDIYGTHGSLKKAFAQFAAQVKPGGTLIIKKGAEVSPLPAGVGLYSYSLDGPADFYARDITLLDGGYYRFDIVCPDRVIGGCRVGIPGIVNVENAVAAVALLWAAGFEESGLKEGLATFTGVKRRFETWINTPGLVYMDDYAHHPSELSAAISSIRGMFPGRELTAVFQPHLYTRTRDFHEGFAQALSLADEVVLLPIYPARELPIEGVDAELIGRDITVPHRVVPKEKIVEELAARRLDVVVTFGAGDIDAWCAPVARMLAGKYNVEVQ